MKDLVSLLLTVLSLAQFGCEINGSEGTWELVSARYAFPDTTYEISMQDHRHIKVITKTHFAWLNQKSNRQKFIQAGTDSEFLEGAKSLGAGGGAYTWDGQTYTEYIEFFVPPKLIGTAIPYKVKVENDQL